MSTFIETPRFPDDIAVWAVGGRGFNTTVTDTYGGQEYRNAAWSIARGEWSVAEALRETNPNAARAYIGLRNMHMVTMGQLGGFRFKDFKDFTDEANGILGATGLAVASTVAYQMNKKYFISPLTYVQIVLKPALYTITIYNNAVLVPQPAGCVIDYSTGIVTFASQPTVGHTLTWVGEFDIPVRFGGDDFPMGLDQTGALYNWQSLKLIEIRNPNG